MSKPIERIIKTNGISLNVVEQGEGPLVLLCHGFPESWYSWRHQIDALASAGFHAPVVSKTSGPSRLNFTVPADPPCRFISDSICRP